MGPDTEVLRRRWPEVLDTIKGLRRVTWALVDPRNAQVAELDATTLRLSFDTAALATTFRNGAHADVVARAVRETLGFDIRVEAILNEPGGRGAAAGTGPGPGQAPATDPGQSSGSATGGRARPSAGDGAHDDAATRRAEASWDEVPPPTEPPAEDLSMSEDPWAGPPTRATAPAPDQPSPPGAAERNDASPPPWDPVPGSARERGIAAAAATARSRTVEVDDPRPDDPEIAASGLVGAPLIAQMLGGTVIDEELDDPRG